MQSRYYNPEIGRFINADILIHIDKEIIGVNVFNYCLNNPILYLDENGKSAALPPMIENGLNLPATGGMPVTIDGTTYYYAIDIQNGELYEYWFNEEGDLIWGRHHSDHNKPGKHDDPHDHKGGKDDKGNNTLVGGPQPVDEKFHGPHQYAYRQNNDLDGEKVIVGVAAGLVIYQVAKWTIATFLAAFTGGGSLTVAAVTP